ncbi:MAG: DUF1553 domain-containing protein [Acidobacteria bacterium]|nr:DUF1553 domain-containing protein [Acidobacteriota bacterium]
MRWLLLTLAGMTLCAEDVRFSRDILPILSEKCFACHGQEERGRMAGLRLDTREDATAARKSGAAIVPGNPAASAILARIAPQDPKRLMPPAYSHKAPLDAKQVALLKDWIAQGAPWGRHWSFETPTRPRAASIDDLVASRLAKENLRISPRAPRHTLARRLAFDLTGLPPRPGALPDGSSAATARYIDELLESPQFGERMAMWWLDGARYADTDGFQADETRTNWPWRDWVVAAFNRNMRFDRFTIEQFAGDLLPNAAPEQILATAFHRNHMTNGEGGRDPEESRVDYVIDRTNTTGTVWLGLTLGCTQCHSHKFDPVSHHDYYSLTAFFDSIDEDGRAGKRAKPYLKYRSPHAARAIDEAQALLDVRVKAEAAARAAAQQPFERWLAARYEEVRHGYQAWRRLVPSALESVEGSQLSAAADGIVTASGPNPKQDDYRAIFSLAPATLTGLKLEVIPNKDGKLGRGASGEFILSDIKVQVRRRGSAQVRDILVTGAVADYSAPQKEARNYGDIKGTLDDDPRNGWTTAGAPAGQTHTAVFELAEPLELVAGEELVFELRQRSTMGDSNIANFRLFYTGEPGPAVQSLGPTPLEQLASKMAEGPNVRERLFTQFLLGHGPYRAPKQALDRARKQFDEVKASAEVEVMVLGERPQPRTSHVLLRGVWDKKGDPVAPGALPAIAPWPEGAPRNRLGLAQWLVSPRNPLTARVIANQLWQLLFGEGLVRTTEDFGLQGEQPYHAELLDWLAVEFIDSGWDVKHMLRLMANSRTYQQASNRSGNADSRLLTRAPRYRLPSWMLRDAALSYAGLLNTAIGGPPIRPYQPDGVWEELFMGRFQYLPSEGTAQHRRTLYAFWRRSIAPTFLFDNAQRRSCEVRVPRTNTPLQALTLLNDETYLEAARAIALRSTDPAVIFETILSRPADAKELAVLRREFSKARQHYGAHPQEASKLLRAGGGTPDQAAAMLVASMVLNLDETITHE